MFVYGLFSLFFWVLLIMGVFALVRSFAGGDRQPLPPPSTARSRPSRSSPSGSPAARSTRTSSGSGSPRCARDGRTTTLPARLAKVSAEGPLRLGKASPFVPEEQHQPGRAVMSGQAPERKSGCPSQGFHSS